MQYISYIIVSIAAILFGQVAGHLNKKMPPVVAEEITYKEFFLSLKNDFKVDVIFTMVYLIFFNLLVYFKGSAISTYLNIIVMFALSLAFSIDFKYQLIPDETHIVILVASIINIILNYTRWWDFVLAAIIGGLIFYLLNLLALLLFKKEGMGFGDVKLMSALGLFFGIKQILVITLVSFFVGAIVGSIVMIIKRKSADEYMPFGPFIVIAAVCIMFVPADYIIELFIAFCSMLGMYMTDGIYWLLEKFR